ncbi:hypothetical protein ATG_13850 [Desulfurococcaceae archaeon AG1]|jgi:fatty-acyl-CoA synthase|nr:hypothetical protein ATG_13850 [Desulfurococcaceae archaeon AG1]
MNHNNAYEHPVPDLAEVGARLYPDRIAIVDYSWGSREEYSYRDAAKAADNIASMLEEIGVGKGDRVAVLSYNNAEYVFVYLATIKKGAILAPLSWRATPKDLAFMIDDVEPSLIFYQEELKDLLEQALKISSPRPLIEKIETLRGIYKRQIQRDYRKENVRGSDISMLLYTGGTTGTLKAAMIPYRQVIWNAINTIISWGLTRDDIAPLFFPLFHTGGWHVITIPLYMIGGRIIITKRFDPEEALDIIEKEKCTLVIAVPTAFYMLTKSPKFKDASFKNIKFFKSGGGMSPYSLVKIYWDKGVRYFQGYGLTEAGPNLLYTPPEDMEKKPMSVGKQSLFAELKIVKDDGTEARPGEVGELLVRGPITFSGYWKRPEETKETITEDGWVRTGDLFIKDEDGHYYFVERKKFMIKSGGENIYPFEVEERIREHPGVEEVAVFGVPDEKWGEAVAAAIKPRAGYQIDPQAIRDFLRGRIAGYKIPKYVWIVHEIPKTAVGKVDYVYLKKKFSELLKQQGS